MPRSGPVGTDVTHNLESWQFIDVRDPATRGRLRHYCLDQAPALQAPNFIVAVARPDFWRCGRRLMLDAIAREPDSVVPLKSLLVLKYRVQIPLIFADGPFHILAPLKRLVTWCLGLLGPSWRVDVGRSGQVLWATKTTALACQALMLALRAAGYDSCAMEGFDEPRVKRLLKLPRAARVVGHCRRAARPGGCDASVSLRSKPPRAARLKLGISSALGQQ